MRTSAFFVGVNLSSGTMAVVERNSWTHPESDPMTWSFHPQPVFRVRAAQQFTPGMTAASLLTLANQLAVRTGQAPTRVFVDVGGSAPRASEFAALADQGVCVIPQNQERKTSGAGRLICPEHLQVSGETMAAARLAQQLASPSQPTA